MFNVKDNNAIPIRTPDGMKIAVLAYPTDAQWTQWRRRKKLHHRDLGRRKTRPEMSAPEQADLDLFNAVFIADPQEVELKAGESLYSLPSDTEDATADADYFIQRMAKCEIADEPEREGNLFVVHMKVMGGVATSHALRVPSKREEHEFNRGRVGLTFQQFGKNETTINLSASGDLYDKVAQKDHLHGYEGGIVPVIHKAEAVNALLQAIEFEQDGEAEDAAGE